MDPSLENCDEITGDAPMIHVLPGVNDNLSQAPTDPSQIS